MKDALYMEVAQKGYQADFENGLVVVGGELKPRKIQHMGLGRRQKAIIYKNEVLHLSKIDKLQQELC